MVIGPKFLPVSLIATLNERKIFQTQKVSELDYLAKIGCELFELMFGQADEYLKWGETVSSTTTATKLLNNGNKSRTIGCKVDGRIVCLVDKPLDLCQIEASKVTATENKLFNDKVKLAIESKCILDDIVSRPNYSFASDTHSIHNIQLSGVQAQVCTLTLVDAGLYVHVPDYELSLPNNIIDFSNIAISWVRKLIAFKASCHRNYIIHTTAITPTKDTLAETFGGRSKHQSNERQRKS